MSLIDKARQRGLEVMEHHPEADLINILDRLDQLQSQLDSIRMGEIPEYLQDPVSHGLLSDPYVAEDGRTYNLSTIQGMAVDKKLAGPFFRNLALMGVVQDYAATIGAERLIQDLNTFPKAKVIGVEHLIPSQKAVWYKPGSVTPKGTQNILDIARSIPDGSAIGILIQNTNTRYGVLNSKGKLFIQRVFQSGTNIQADQPISVPLESLKNIPNIGDGKCWPSKFTNADGSMLYARYPSQEFSLEGPLADGSGILVVRITMGDNWWSWALPAVATMMDFAIFA